MDNYRLIIFLCIVALIMTWSIWSFISGLPKKRQSKTVITSSKQVPLVIKEKASPDASTTSSKITPQQIGNSGNIVELDITLNKKDIARLKQIDWSQTPEKLTLEESYEIIFDIAAEKASNVYKFTLFDTKAAIFWNDNDYVITVVCVNAFIKGCVTGKSYDLYDYNLDGDYWSGIEPRGCKTAIKAEIDKNRHNFLLPPKRSPFDEHNELYQKIKNLHKNEHRFELYKTKACIFWSEGNTRIHIICIDKFKHQKPIDARYSCFSYDLKHNYWKSGPPSGASNEIKKEIEQIRLLKAQNN